MYLSMPFHTASRQEMKDLCSINPWMVRSNRFDDMFFDSSGQNTAVSSDKKLQKILLSGKSARKKVKTFSHTRTSRGREGGTEQGQPATTKQKRNQSKTTKAENGKGSTQKAGRTKEGKGGEGGGESTQDPNPGRQRSNSTKQNQQQSKTTAKGRDKHSPEGAARGERRYGEGR